MKMMMAGVLQQLAPTCSNPSHNQTQPPYQSYYPFVSPYMYRSYDNPSFPPPSPVVSPPNPTIPPPNPAVSEPCYCNSDSDENI